MSLYKTAEYRVNQGSIAEVEKAMHRHAENMRRMGMLWWTVKDGNRYLSLIIAPDKQTNERASTCEDTDRFVDVLYPNVIGEVEWTDWKPVAGSHTLPNQPGQAPF